MFKKFNLAVRIRTFNSIVSCKKNKKEQAHILVLHSLSHPFFFKKKVKKKELALSVSGFVYIHYFF